jgi:hypothetical protein
MCLICGMIDASFTGKIIAWLLEQPGENGQICQPVFGSEVPGGGEKPIGHCPHRPPVMRTNQSSECLSIWIITTGDM